MRIAVAMSGGVDSSVAAALLAREGHEVTGLFMKTGVESGEGAENPRRCCSLDDAWDAQRVADQIGIRFYALNYKERFRKVLEDFADSYQAGKTPNPCVRCNQWLKFGALADEARALGCEAIATGHYARIEERAGRHRLLRAVDPEKDQSYVLFALRARDLAAIRFPLGGMSKGEVRKIAAEIGLPVKDKPDSQDLCFAPKGGYREVIGRYRKNDPAPGTFVDTAGNILGRHDGIENFTVGQRKGLGIALGKPAYVVRIEPDTRRVVLGEEEALLSSGCTLADVNWLSDDAPPGPIRARVKIRYTHEPAGAEVTPGPGATATVRFDAPQRSVTPGQAAVFYEGNEVLGGGWIGSTGNRRS